MVTGATPIQMNMSSFIGVHEHGDYAIQKATGPLEGLYAIWDRERGEFVKELGEVLFFECPEECIGYLDALKEQEEHFICHLS